MSDFHPVCTLDELQAEGKKTVIIDESIVVVCLVDGAVYCIDDVCTHDGGPLGEGKLDGYEIACPRHGAKFDVRTGAPLTMPATEPTLAHEAKVVEGQVFVKLHLD